MRQKCNATKTINSWAGHLRTASLWWWKVCPDRQILDLLTTRLFLALAIQAQVNCHQFADVLKWGMNCLSEEAVKRLLTVSGVTMMYSRGDESRADATQTAAMTLFVRPELHHVRDLSGWTIAMYLQPYTHIYTRALRKPPPSSGPGVR